MSDSIDEAFECWDQTHAALRAEITLLRQQVQQMGMVCKVLVRQLKASWGEIQVLLDDRTRTQKLCDRMAESLSALTTKGE